MVLRASSELKGGRGSRSSWDFSSGSSKLKNENKEENKVEEFFNPNIAQNNALERLSRSSPDLLDSRYKNSGRRTSLPATFPISDPAPTVSATACNQNLNSENPTSLGSTSYTTAIEEPLSPFQMQDEQKSAECEELYLNTQHYADSDEVVDEPLGESQSSEDFSVPWLSTNEYGACDIRAANETTQGRSQTNTSTKITIVEKNDAGSMLVQEHKIHQGPEAAQQESRDRENRRQKLETELRERLKLERQKRLAQEKALRLGRLRQELKETEREEARLQKWLAHEENTIEQYHTVGSYTSQSLNNILTKDHVKEFDLTTPADLRQRNKKSREFTSGPHQIQSDSQEWIQTMRLKYGQDIQVTKIAKDKIPLVQFRTLNDVNGKTQVVIQDLRGELKSQGKLRVGDHVIAFDWNEIQETKTSTDDILRRFLEGKRQTTTLLTIPNTPLKNMANEM